MPGADPAATVLALNSGSSSLKFGVYRAGPAGAEVLLSGEAEAIGGGAGGFSVRDAAGSVLSTEATAFADQGEAVGRIARAFAEAGMPPLDAVGHRIVHGGPKLRQHCPIDDAVLHQLRSEE